jgi:hypothetical protein
MIRALADALALWADRHDNDFDGHDPGSTYDCLLCNINRVRWRAES